MSGASLASSELSPQRSPPLHFAAYDGWSSTSAMIAPRSLPVSAESDPFVSFEEVPASLAPDESFESFEEVPASLVPEDLRDQLATCTGGFCTPDKFIESAGQGLPESCRSIAGVEGRCLSQCLPEVAGQPLLPRGGCDADERCVPCYDPTSGSPTMATGACGIASCDMPAEDPVVLTCPWTGPPVINPNVLPSCSPTCGGAHCLRIDGLAEAE